MYVVPEHLRPKVDDRLCICVITPAAVLSWTLGRREDQSKQGKLPDRPGKPERVARVNRERLAEADLQPLLPEELLLHSLKG